VEDRISEFEDKIYIKKINRRNQSNNSGAVKRICKNSLTPSKGKT
jgi:hypothetical protein